MDCASFRDGEAIEACTRSTMAHKSLIRFPEYISTVSAPAAGGEVFKTAAELRQAKGSVLQVIREGSLKCQVFQPVAIVDNQVRTIQPNQLLLSQMA